jgi:hypothetical protein
VIKTRGREGEGKRGGSGREEEGKRGGREEEERGKGDGVLRGDGTRL